MVWPNEENEFVHFAFPQLYSQYFENETLLQATMDAGIPEHEAKGMMDVKMVDSIPSITFEGKRRDLTLVGAKEVEEYLKTLETIARESK